MFFFFFLIAQTSFSWRLICRRRAIASHHSFSFSYTKADMWNKSFKSFLLKSVAMTFHTHVAIIWCQTAQGHVYGMCVCMVVVWTVQWLVRHPSPSPAHTSALPLCWNFWHCCCRRCVMQDWALIVPACGRAGMRVLGVRRGRTRVWPPTPVYPPVCLSALLVGHTWARLESPTWLPGLYLCLSFSFPSSVSSYSQDLSISLSLSLSLSDFCPLYTPVIRLISRSHSIPPYFQIFRVKVWNYNLLNWLYLRMKIKGWESITNEKEVCVSDRTINTDDKLVHLSPRKQAPGTHIN